MRKVAVIAAMLLPWPVAAQTVTLKGCYAETSLAGTFIRAGNREATGSIGMGCDTNLDKLIVGGGIRADLGDDINAGTIYGKIGMAINAATHLYGLAAWSIPDWKIRDAGQLHLGFGAETQFVVNGLSLFGEGTVAASKFGAGATRDDVQARVGARYRF